VGHIGVVVVTKYQCGTQWGVQMVVPQCGPHQGVEMSVSPVWATLWDPQCGNPGVAQIGIYRETPNVGPQCGPPNATLGETRPQCTLGNNSPTVCNIRVAC
jgi:hypothetical protein